MADSQKQEDPKNSEVAIQEPDEEVYESHPAWKTYRAQSKKHSYWSVPLACVCVVGSAWSMSKHGLGFGKTVDDRMGNNLSMIGIVWILMAVVLVRIFRSIWLSSYSQEFRQTARNLMARTADADLDKRWDSSQLVRYLGTQLSRVPQDGVILTNIIQLERYSLTALIDAAERAKEEVVLKVMLKFERTNQWMSAFLFVISALFSAIVCWSSAEFVKNISGKDSLVYIALLFCLISVGMFAWAMYKGQDPEKLINALVKIFVGFGIAVGACFGTVKLVDFLRDAKKAEVIAPVEVPTVLPKSDAKKP